MLRIRNDEVLQADRRDHLPLPAVNDAARCVETHMPTDDHVVLLVPLEDSIQGRPRPQVIPPEAASDHANAGRLFEHAVIYRYLFESRIDLREDLFVRRGPQRRADFLEFRPVIRQMFFKQALDHTVPPDEYARIPEVVRPCKITPRSPGIRFLVKSQHPIDTRRNLRSYSHISIP